MKKRSTKTPTCILNLTIRLHFDVVESQTGFGHDGGKSSFDNG